MNPTKPNAFLNADPVATGDPASQVIRNGWCLLPNLLSAFECNSMIQECVRLIDENVSGSLSTRGKTFGARNLLDHWDGWRVVLEKENLRSVLSSIPGRECGLVRMLWFDKPPGAGWALPWHRDQTIAVQKHPVDASPFSKPTTKSGVPHLIAPDGLLQNMLTVRIHLDPMLKENGPLQVITGSHLNSESTALENETDQNCIETILTSAGTVFLMRPLLLHGSLPSEPDTTMHRRILHMEFAPSVELPGEVQWRDFVPVRTGGREIRSGAIRA